VDLPFLEVPGKCSPVTWLNAPDKQDLVVLSIATSGFVLQNTIPIHIICITNAGYAALVVLKDDDDLMFSIDLH